MAVAFDLSAETPAFELVRYYALRWRIERYPYVQKSGALEVEKLRFDDLEPVILQSKSKKKITTLKQAIFVMVKFVAFEPSKKYPMPGLKNLAQSLEILAQYVKGCEIT